MSGNTANPSGSVQAGPMTLADAASALDQMLLPIDGEEQTEEGTQLTDGDEPEVAASEEESLEVQDEESNEETKEEQSEEDEQPEEEEQPQVYTVKVDGKEIEVTLDELQKGYSRTQDYTRKTQQVAEIRKQVEAETAAIRAEREQYAQLLGALQQQLESANEPQVDLDRLYQEGWED